MRRVPVAVAMALALFTATASPSGLAAAEGVVPAPEPPFYQHFNIAGGLPSGWTGTGQVFSGTGEGGGSLRVIDNSTTAYAVAWSPFITVDVERSYDLTVKARVDDPTTTDRVAVLVEQYYSNLDRFVYRWLEVTSTIDWRLNRINVTTAGRAAYIRIGLYAARGTLAETGTAWFDTLSIVSAPQRDPVIDAYGRLVPVSDVQNVTSVLTPEDFWSHVPEAPADLAVSGRSLWSYPLLRRHYLGTDLGEPQVVYNEHSAMPGLDKTVGVSAPTACVPIGNNANPLEPDPDRADAAALTCPAGTQEQVYPENQQFVVAKDIRHNPIVSAHPYNTGKYTKLYYPRRTSDYLQDLYQQSLLPASVLTGDDPAFAARATQLLDFMSFSQYSYTGANSFTSTHYPTEYREAPEWKGGWDFGFNFTWTDGYGYQWKLHEPDHHVNSGMAKAMVRGYELYGDPADLESAWRFVDQQMPRYGFHTGMWNGSRYYWTEYNPTGSYPKLDATDNVQALVARAAAMVGYHTDDRRMLEYARGLMWYCIREYTSDGTWFYDGAENPMNQRKFVSHDAAVLLPLLGTLPYLSRAGINVDREMATLTQAYDKYRDNNLAGLSRVAKGQASKPSPIWDVATRTWKVTAMFTANRDVTGLTFADSVSNTTLSTVDVTVETMAPPSKSGDQWTVAGSQTFHLAPNSSAFSVATGVSMRPGDFVRVSYTVPGLPATWTNCTPGSFSFTDAGTAYTVKTTVGTPRFPTIVTPSNFFPVAARLAFPPGPETQTHTRTATR